MPALRYDSNKERCRELGPAQQMQQQIAAREWYYINTTINKNTINYTINRTSPWLYYTIISKVLSYVILQSYTPILIPTILLMVIVLSIILKLLCQHDCTINTVNYTINSILLSVLYNILYYDSL